MELSEYKTMDKIEDGHWWFKAKRNFLQIAIRRHLKENKNLKILDIGCGTGGVMKFLKERGYEIRGLDMHSSAIDYCRAKGLKVDQGRADKIDIADSQMDIVLALDLLEHLDHPESALKEISRVLKNDGLFISTVPAHQFLWSYHDIILHHKKRYGKKDFKSLLSSSFKIETVSWIHASILFPAMLVRLINRNKIKKYSDVKESGNLIDLIMKFVYFFELTFFRLFNFLPCGLSLLAVARKNENK